MSVMTAAAERDFKRAMTDAHNLLKLHLSSQQGKGRRHRQPSLNRGAVVMTVAAWQAFVQDMAKAVLGEIAIPHGQKGHGLYRVIKVGAKRSLSRFNTPNARNSLDLFSDVGFDPTPSWSFVMGNPPAKYRVADIRAEVDCWLEVRHKIAHGSPLPETHLVSGRTKRGPTLHRSDAEQCIEFFEALVAVTAAAAAAQYP